MPAREWPVLCAFGRMRPLARYRRNRTQAILRSAGAPEKIAPTVCRRTNGLNLRAFEMGFGERIMLRHDATEMSEALFNHSLREMGLLVPA